ncbi:hypothetical protein Tco_1487708 [Tanacetum coccineum]
MPCFLGWCDLRRQNVDLQRHVELLTERLNEFVNLHRHEDGVTVTNENLFGALRNRSLERSANPDEIMDFKNVPDNRSNLRQGTRSIDEYITDFYECLAQLDLNESLFQLVSHYIGGLRLQLQDVLNLFDPLTVGKAHQRASQAEKQLNHRKPGGFHQPPFGWHYRLFCPNTSLSGCPRPLPLLVVLPTSLKGVPAEACVVLIAMSLVIENQIVKIRNL